MARNSEKPYIWEIHTVGTELWQENWKRWKMRHKHCMTLNIARNIEKLEKWEIDTLEPGIYRENWKKKVDNEKHTL